MAITNEEQRDSVRKDIKVGFEKRDILARLPSCASFCGSIILAMIRKGEDERVARLRRGRERNAVNKI